MPTKRFSTRSTRPMPCSPPNLLSSVSSVAGERFSPSTATASPFSKRLRHSRLFGRFSGERCASTNSGGSAEGSSRTCPRRRCRRFASSRERRFTSFVRGDRNLVLLRHRRSASSRELEIPLRHGAITGGPAGARSSRARSAPGRCLCRSRHARRRRHRASRAISTWRLAISGRAMEVPSRYWPS